VSIVGSRVTRAGREWEVASIVRASGTLRVIFKATDDLDCKIVTRMPADALPTRAADLGDALACPEYRSFRDPAGTLWRVESNSASDVGTPYGGWLVFSPDCGGQSTRVRLERPEGLASISEDELVKMLFQARQTTTELNR
jgi:hypothetical protein